MIAGKEFAEKENLKEMGDVSSGMASTIIQIFLKVISFLLRSSCTKEGRKFFLWLYLPLELNGRRNFFLNFFFNVLLSFMVGALPLPRPRF